jgi:hypothetical protein
MWKECQKNFEEGVQDYPRRKRVRFKDKKLVVEHCRKYMKETVV